MKKIIILLVFLFLFSINITTNAASWKYTWTNTVIDIPLGDAIEKYKYLPKASLYKNNTLLSDANITYLRDGDWLYYLNDVNTKKVGTYYVWYKAFENEKYKPGTCTDYKCKIAFNVIDNIAPEIIVLNNQVSIRAKSEYNLLDNIVAKDNYYNELDYKINSNVNYDVPGLYEATIYVTDGSKNVSEASFKINVYDNSIPEITKIKNEPLKFEIGTNIDLSSYFSAYDDVDKNISNKIIYPSIKNDEVGIKTYNLSVSDSAGNTSTLDIDVEIYDPCMPEVILYNDSIILDYNTNFNNYDFKKYIKEIKDNEIINYDNLIITNDLKNEVGSYNVYYTYYDKAYEAKALLNVKLISFTKPTIKTQVINIKEGEYVDLADYVKVYDSSDPNIKDSLVIYDTDVNYYKEGNYYAEAYVINSSGISNTANIEIKVLSNKEYNKYIGNDTNSFIEIKDFIYIGIFIFLIIGFIVFFIILKKKKKI